MQLQLMRENVQAAQLQNNIGHPRVSESMPDLPSTQNHSRRHSQVNTMRRDSQNPLEFQHSHSGSQELPGDTRLSGSQHPYVLCDYYDKSQLLTMASKQKHHATKLSVFTPRSSIQAVRHPTAWLPAPVCFLESSEQLSRLTIAHQQHAAFVGGTRFSGPAPPPPWPPT